MMKQKDLASESSDPQLVEQERPHLSSRSAIVLVEHEQKQKQKQKRPLVPSQSTDLSSNNVEDEVTLDITEMIPDPKDGPPSPTCCIYRVPITIRDLKENAYTPTVVSIGPFHHGNEKLQEMEKHKKFFFKRFTERFSQNSTSSFDNLVCHVQDSEPKIRASYSETISPNIQLVKLTLMDAVFIIELFLMDFEKGNYFKPWLENAIFDDLILLENQLPFFIIEELFNKAFPKEHHESLLSFLELTYSYFGYYNKQEFQPISKINHFTDLVRLFYLDKRDQSEQSASSASSETESHCLFHNFVKLFYLNKRDQSEQPASSETESHDLVYNVNYLHEAGIKLKASTSKCLLKLKLSGHVLEIPHILVDDRTEIVFRNMIALEQCHYPNEGYITDYVYVMDWLIDTSKDVELLVHKKIVRNYLGEANNVAVLFNGLAENVCHDSNREYVEMCKKLNGYCEDCWPRRKANLRRDYCRTPWQTVASIAGIVLVVLTVVQTVFSILQVV